MLQALLLCLLLLLGFLSSFAMPDVSALSPEYQTSFENELRLIIAKNPRYLWGGSESESQGLDCSGYLTLAARRAGMPVTRTTAYRMSQGLDGWSSVKVNPSDMSHLDISFWTWRSQPNRPEGHTGVIMIEPGEVIPRVTHASTKRGVILEPLKGPFLRDLTTLRRLILGDQ